MTVLNDRTVLSVSGPDRLNFLQGLVTQDVHQLAAHGILYSALLSPQGRYLFDFFLIDQPDTIWIDVAADQREALRTRLSLYKLRADVTLENVSVQVSGFWDVPPPAALVDCFEDPRLPALGWRGYIAGPTICEPSVHHDYAAHCRRLGVPQATDMVPGKGIPLECGLGALHAISWTKGCYIGQELTVRVKHQGLIRKHLLPVSFEGGDLPFGAPLICGDSVAGEMRTAQSGQGIALVRLEYVPRALQDPGFLQCEGRVLCLEVPPWIRGALEGAPLSLSESGAV